MQGKGGLLLAAGLAALLLVFAARSLSSPSSLSLSLSSRHQQQAARAPTTTTGRRWRRRWCTTRRRAPCNFLVFGLGLDSPMWAALNAGGRTAFLEEDAAWIASVRARHPRLESHHVACDTVLADADALLRLRRHPPCVAQPDLAAARAAGCRLAMSGLPPALLGGEAEVEWDLVMVDAPTGWTPRSPGRTSAIYTGPTHVFVHDVNRPVEDRFSKAFLCEGYLVEQVGRIRHFVIPSHRSDEQDAMPFCPSQDG